MRELCIYSLHWGVTFTEFDKNWDEMMYEKVPRLLAWCLFIIHTDCNLHMYMCKKQNWKKGRTILETKCLKWIKENWLTKFFLHLLHHYESWSRDSGIPKCQGLGWERQTVLIKKYWYLTPVYWWLHSRRKQCYIAVSIFFINYWSVNQLQTHTSLQLCV